MEAPPHLLTLSVPLYALLILIEVVYYRLHPDENASGYTLRDTAANVAIGAGVAIVDIFWKGLAFVAFVGLYELTPLRIPVTWATFPLILLAQDFCYYWMHREHHVVRVLWASHVVHHSSRLYNYTTSIRQPWTGVTSQLFYVPLILVGVPPWAVFLCGSINMLSQFWLHTDRIGRLHPAVEYIFNTPSHHRVHHASQGGYLDRNFGGIHMLWDRLFGTYADEVERPVYGLTKNIDTHNPFRIAFHEYASIGQDLAAAPTWRQRARHLLDRPGWQPPSPEKATAATDGEP
ncbi:sterol desaturase family protein [Streptomyces cucumeris]|uniref:sterol desaturase family protein n=1 Tax=Streptomyces cucumeris TaxID=2962890 RepID=UPI003D75B357